MFQRNSKKPIIEKIFPQPIYLLDDFYSEGHQELKSWLLEFFTVNGEFKRTDELNVNTTHNVIQLEDADIFKDFIVLLTRHVNDFASRLGYDTTRHPFGLTNFWSNISRRGEHLFPHNHPGSVISGAYYVESTSVKDSLKFYSDIKSGIPPAPHPNEYSYEYMSYQCLEKRLLLFRSDMVHGCADLKGERKIVISFNFSMM